MVSHDGEDRFFHYQVQAFAGVGAVPDDIAEAHNFINILRCDISENGLERLQIAVDIADQCLPHAINLAGNLSSELN